MPELNEAVIISAARTPVGKFLGSLKGFSATELGSIVVRESVKRAGIKPEDVDEVIMGCVIQAGLGQNPARQAALNGGIPSTVAAVTVNKVCGSGLKAVMMAAQGVQLGDTEIVVAGGMESMSNAPYLIPKAREGYRLGNGELVDSMINDGLWCAFDAVHMGAGTENYVGQVGNITREAQDEAAAKSHERAAAAQKEGRFADEITPVSIKQRKGDPVVVDTDEGVRPGTTPESLASLRPAFSKDGTITAGNASQISDGSAALLMMTAEKAQELGLTPIARVHTAVLAGADPVMMLTAPIPATEKALKKSGLRIDEIGAFEVNEAFAPVPLAWLADLGADAKALNPNGGAIALGHPLGGSGARLMTTLLHHMRDNGIRYGLQTMCEGGGQANATILELL